VTGRYSHHLSIMLSLQQTEQYSTAREHITFRILSVVVFTFIVYFSIGAPLALLPMYAHQQLGVSASVAGLLVSLQYIATFASRPRAGRMTDTRGPRQTVLYGLLCCASSGILLLTADLLRHSFGLSIVSLVFSRIALGVGESMASTGAIMWGIGRAGLEHTARVVSWNGVACYLALAIGAPVGAMLGSRRGFFGVGLLTFLLGVAGFMVAAQMSPTASIRGCYVPLFQILRRVTPYGLGLALGGIGFGVIETFITLYFAHRGWPGAALSLTIYGVSFVGARFAFAGAIDRFGGLPVAFVSLLTEAAGLLLLGFGNTPRMAYAGCALTGLGFSLVFPALAVEAASVFPASVRGSGLVSIRPLLIFRCS
jgi:MFS family permease